MRNYLGKLFSGPRYTVASILIGNLIPVFGVAFLGWDAVQILILYWVENLIIGVLTLPRILAAQAPDIRSQSAHNPFTADEARGLKDRASTGCFFVVHYGVFCIGHAVFAFMLAGDFVKHDGVGAPGVWDRTFASTSFYWAILAIALVNVVSQIRDWWMRKLWREATPLGEMFRPYGRIMVLHVTVLFGAWLMVAANAPTYAVLLLCLMKTVAELGALAFSSIADPRSRSA